MSDERTNLMEEAKALGLNPHHRTGVENLRVLIAEAKGAESIASNQEDALKEAVKPGFRRVRVTKHGDGRISTGARFANHDVCYKKGDEFDLPADIAEYYEASPRFWVEIDE